MNNNFYRAITINAAKCGSASSTGFKLLISGTYSWAATSANGGRVQNTTTVSVGGQTLTVPADLGFSLATNAGAALLSWEFEQYNSTTGQMLVWVYVGNISNITGTTVYCVYDDTGTTTFQGGARGATWDANDAAVYHFMSGSTLYPYDSTSNAYNLTNNNTATAVTGEIDGGVGLAAASSQYLNVASVPVSAFPMTFSCWFKLSASPSTDNTFIALNSTSGTESVWVTYLTTGPYLRGLIRHAGSSYFVYATIATDTNWHYLSVVFTSTSSLVLYLDGNAPTTAISGTPITPTGFNDLTIGAGLTPTLYGAVNGTLDEVRLRNIAVGASLLVAEYNNQSSPSTFYSVGPELSVTDITPTFMRGIGVTATDYTIPQPGLVWYNTTRSQFQAELGFSGDLYGVQVGVGTVIAALYTVVTLTASNAVTQTFGVPYLINFPAGLLAIVGKYLRIKFNFAWNHTVANTYNFGAYINGTPMVSVNSASLTGSGVGIIEISMVALMANEMQCNIEMRTSGGTIVASSATSWTTLSGFDQMSFAILAGATNSDTFSLVTALVELMA